ncbi:MAG: TMEM165/GDT1 family protein, partial [Pseudonocardiaceae bacterium]
MEFTPLLLAFAQVLPAELPDKTMVATLLLSARYRPGPVLLGVSVAFAAQCVIAVAFG